MTSYSEIKVFLFIVFLLISSSAVALSSLPGISFYGRVIDQNGQPFKNAMISYIGANAYLLAGGGQGVVYTDKDGYFEIGTTGASLQLGGVGHPEIDRVLFDTPEGKPSIVTGFGSNDRNGEIFNYNNYTDKENAYIIYAWRLGEYEGAINGNINGFYDANGKSYTLKLDQINADNYPIDGEVDGQLHVSCTREHMENLLDYGDWSISITPVKGGIQESNDKYMNIAPTTGYKSSININMHLSDDGYSHKLKKHYYFKSNNGKEHGRLIVDMNPFRSHTEDACVIFIRYKINPTGSRNLELKKNNVRY